MANCMPSKSFKTNNRKILHVSLSVFFRQSMIKIMGKTAIWTFLCFHPLPPLSNVEKH